MSITFFVKNKKKPSGDEAPVMSVEEALRLVPNLSQFNADEDDEEFDAEGFYSTKLSELGCLTAGADGLSGRGIEVCYEDGAYNVCIGTPSTRTDWRIALEYLKNLALKMDGEITSEDGEKFSAQNIEGFDFESDIRAGLANIKRNLEEKAVMCTIYGVRNEVSFDQKIIARIMDAPDPADEFSKFVTDIQNLNAYFSDQMFSGINEDSEIIGRISFRKILLPYYPLSPAWITIIYKFWAGRKSRGGASPFLEVMRIIVKSTIFLRR